MEEEQGKKKVIKYLTPHHDDYFAGVVFTVIGVICVWVGIVDEEVQNAVLGALFAVLLGGGFLAAAINSTVHFRKAIEFVEQSGAMQTLIQDREQGRKVFKDSITLGQNYILGKCSGEIIKYTDVERIYQYIEKETLGERKRCLRLEIVGGRKVDIGKIPLRGKGNEELQQVVEYICSINPLIEVGYVG